MLPLPVPQRDAFHSGCARVPLPFIDRANMAEQAVTPLIAQFVGPDKQASDSALAVLSDIASDSYGAEAANLAALLRSGGCIPLLVNRMDDPGMDVQQCAMSLVGNLLTDVFDEQARVTLDLFAAAGGLPSLQAKLKAEYPLNLFAAAALQNVTALDPEDCCALLREQSCDTVLTSLVQSDNEQVSMYATGALANLRAYDPAPPEDPALEEMLRMRRLRDIVEAMQSKKATDKVQFYAKRWIDRHRAVKKMQSRMRGSLARKRRGRLHRHHRLLRHLRATAALTASVATAALAASIATAAFAASFSDAAIAAALSHLTSHTSLAAYASSRRCKAPITASFRCVRSRALLIRLTCSPSISKRNLSNFTPRNSMAARPLTYELRHHFFSHALMQTADIL